MRDFMMTLLICSVTMSALALVYMAVTPFLAKRYSVAGRYYAWLVIVVGLIIPFRPRFQNALVKVEIPDSGAMPVLRIGNGTPVTVPTSVERGIPSGLANISWWQIAAALWLVGMILFLVYHGVKHYRFLKMAARWSENITDERTLALLCEIKAQMGLSRDIGIRSCDCTGSPMLIGFVKPRILLPKADFAEDELRFILKHELVHYKRKDLWYKCLLLTATAVHWFNPVVYLMVKAVDMQCELSCDAEVVRGTGSDTRQYYSETMIGVIRYKSNLQTVLSTHFYGGKKGMKKRIYSIMDMKKKKVGLVVLCGTMILTVGTGFAFAPKAEAKNPQEIISEDIMSVPGEVSFVPNPELYASYASFGISISEDGAKLLYKGRPVRLFADEKSDAEAFYFDEAGSVNLSVVRNAADEVTGIEEISAQKAQEYWETFYADDLKEMREAEEKRSDPAVRNKYEAYYQQFGVTYSAEDETLYYKGQRVKVFVDRYTDGWYGTLWTDEAGTVNLAAVRDASGAVTGIETISDEKAQEYLDKSKEDEQNMMDGLEERLERQLEQKYGSSGQ